MCIETQDFYWLFAPVPQAGLHGVPISLPPKQNTTMEQPTLWAPVVSVPISI
jgi:hypothetical protein